MFYVQTCQEGIEKLSRHYPRAVPTYIICLNRAGLDKKSDIFFERQDVINNMFLSWTKFKNDLKMCAIEGLLEFGTLDGGVAVSLNVELK